MSEEDKRKKMKGPRKCIRRSMNLSLFLFYFKKQFKSFVGH